MHPRYHEWIEFVFDHPIRNPQWHFEDDAPQFSADTKDVAVLIRETFSRSGDDLTAYTDAQTNQGIWFLASTSCSDFMFSLREADVPIAHRVAGIQSIYELYRNCFAKRCTETLAHTDDPEASPLNSICYMFWDVCPLSYLEETDQKEILADAVLSVLENIIRIPHRACIEGGLHGLGEIACFHVDRVRDAVDAYLKTATLDKALLAYAERARCGDVQ